MMKLSRPSLNLLKNHKRLVIITVCAFVVVALLGYAAWSKHQWNEYQPSYRTHQAAIQASLDALTSRPVTTATDKAKVRTDLAEVSRQIDARSKKDCQVSPLVAWQVTMVKSLQQEQDQCRAQMAKVTALNEPLKRIVAFLGTDEAVAKEFAKLSSADELADTAWQGQLDSWQSINQAIQKQSVARDYAPIQKLAIEQTDAVAAAWRAIIAAHGAKDKQAFTNAQAGLGQAYDELDTISIETNKVAAELAKAVEVKYRAAF
jgi:hypothetical protein